MYKPICMSRDPEGEERTEDFWFATEDEAWSYVYSRMCSRCTEDRARALAGGEGDDDDLHPACASEWGVVSKAEYEESKKCHEYLDAHDHEPIIGKAGAVYKDYCPKCEDDVVWLYHDVVFYLRCGNCGFRDDVVPQ